MVVVENWKSKKKKIDLWFRMNVQNLEHGYNF